MKERDKLLAFLYLSLAMIFVGSSVVVGKLIISQFPVFLASGLRFLIASIIFLPIPMRVRFKLMRKEVITLFLQSLLGIFGFNVLLLYGLKFTTASISGIITSSTPVVIALIAFLILKEKFNLKRVSGIILALIGIAVLNVMIYSPVSGGSNLLLGNLLVFGAVVCEALFTIFGKLSLKRLSPFVVSAYINFIAFFLFLPIAVLEGLKFDFPSVSVAGWLQIIYYGVIVSVVTYMLWYKGLSKVDASKAGIFTSLMPISALILSYFILSELLLPIHLIGTVLVIAGIILTTLD